MCRCRCSEEGVETLEGDIHFSQTTPCKNVSENTMWAAWKKKKVSLTIGTRSRRDKGRLEPGRGTAAVYICGTVPKGPGRSDHLVVAQLFSFSASPVPVSSAGGHEIFSEDEETKERG